MSKVIGGIFTLLGTLACIYIAFLFANSSWNLEYNDPKLHMSMFQTGIMGPAFVAGVMLTVGLILMFFAKEANPDIKG
jgi:hypothetical protein